MAENKITLGTAQMRRIARHEITFEDVIADAPFKEGDITCQGVYSFTLEDLYCAIKALKASDPTMKDFGEYWLYPITQLSKGFDLERACGELEDFDDVPESMKGYPGLKVSDSAYFSDIWWDLKYAWEDYEDEMHLSEVLDFDAIIADLERYFGNKGKALEDWIFSDEEIKEYIRSFEDDGFVKKADEKQLALARRFIDALCEKDSGLALYIKGYACYGGNRLYPCDWAVSRDCMIRLFEKKDDPQYANTLGYIYYYGRCTGGVPEYDKAFRYFGIAAANGLYEGMYKLADMFCHGYGCKASRRTARSLYGMVYNDSIKNFLRGEHANFADAALRMGNVFAKGIGEEADPVSAYYYYLQADYAARLRAKEDDFFGNTTVVINVRKALAETEALLPENYFREAVVYDFPVFFVELASNNNRCMLSKGEDSGHGIELTAERIPTRAVTDPEEILVTIPKLRYCERTRKVSYKLDETAEVWFKDDASEVRYDYCTWDDVNARLEFYYDDMPAAWVKSKKYCVFGKPAEELTGPEYRIASVRFEASGRTYDYICELEGIEPGDVVVVNGYNGETEVTVTKIVTRRESELGLPAARYKKILRKA